MNKVLIDTDIGGDIDDAIALALALSSPEIEITGITTVYLAARWRAGIIRSMLETYNRTGISIALGAEKPLCGWWDETHIPDTAGESPQIEGVMDMPACDFIIRQADLYNDLVILAIGPLTNVGLALAKAPQIAKRSRVVMMGGQVSRAHPEWNMACDPEAARIVFESGIPISMIGLDVTNRCRFTREHMDTIKAANNQRTDFLYGMMQDFLENFKLMPILHDPLALASIIWPGVLTFEEKTILVETRGEFTRGVTVDCDWRHQPNAMVAVDVMAGEFIDKLLTRLITSQ